MNFTKETYIKRREILKKEMKKGLIIINGNELSPMNYENNVYPFIQDSSFLYFFGIEKEGLIGLIDIDNNKDYLIGEDPDINDIIWEGSIPKLKEYSKQIGTDEVMSIIELERFLENNREKEIFYTPQYKGENKLKIAKLLNLDPYTINENISEKLLYTISELRNKKTKEEIELIEQACKIGIEMHTEAIRATVSSKYEYEVESLIRAIATKNKGNLSFPSIVSVNGQTLHNPYYNGKLAEGRLLLVDAGVRTPSGYCSDMTSTIPVNGKFSEKQRDIYNLLIEMYDNAEKLLRPGISYKEIHLSVCRILAKGMKKRGFLKGDVDKLVEKGVHALFMPHGLGHMLGLDVHDMESFGEKIIGYNGQKKSKQFGLSNLRLGRVLEEGFVLTVEPGIYFIPELIKKWKKENKFINYINYKKVEEYLDFGGMRYENDYLITSEGSKILGGDRAKNADEIEKIMETLIKS